MVRIIKNTMMCLGLICAVAAQSYSQRTDFTPGRIGMPIFSFDALGFSANERGREQLDVFIEIPYESLQFIRKGDKFYSHLEITISVYDSAETLVDEKFLRKTIEVNEYENTVSPALSYVDQINFMLAPGQYLVSVFVKDKETENPSQLKKKINLRSYSGLPLTVSDIMLASRIEKDSIRLTVTPNISGVLGGDQDSVYVFFELYANNIPDSVDILLTVRNMSGTVIKSDSFMQEIVSSSQGVYRKVSIDALIAGDYILDLVGKPLRDSITGRTDTCIARARRTFVIRWRGLPFSISDLDLAIEQLQYIAGREQLEDMRRATAERKRELFQNFWRERDPTPQTERNELMEEYYGRVAYANKHFRHYLDGWKTDMGMIYILFGAPSNIERHPFEMNAKPYEIWSYYEINREFIFVDISGFGEYRLQNTDLDIEGLRQRW